MSTQAKPKRSADDSIEQRFLRVTTSEPVLRLARAIAVSFTIMTIAFAMIRLIPGDPAIILLGENATAKAVAKLHVDLGLTGSLPEQFVRYVVNFVRGDLGVSIATHQPVIVVVERTLPVTLWYIFVVILMSLCLALPLGVLTAIYHQTWFNDIFRFVASLLLAMPIFYSGLVLILIFSIQLGIAPVAGYKPGFPENLRYLWLPALTNSTLLVPILARVLQSSIIDTMQDEFVETAIVRGLASRILVWRYLLRPSIAPTISLLAYIVGQLLGAAVIVEIIFGLPGIGTALVEAVRVRDYPLVQGIIAVFGLIVVSVSYCSDVLSRWIDPRVKREPG